MRALLAAALLAALTSTAFAQDAPADTVALVPGDGQLTTTWITPGTRTFTMRLTAPMRQDVGSATETITVTDGTVTKVTRLSVPMQNMTQTDSVIATAATLAPKLHRSSGGGADASLEFMAEGVAGVITPRQGEATTVMLMTDAPVFDSAWVGEVAQSVPFAEGAVYRLSAFANQSPDEPIDVVLTVMPQETVGERAAWPVAADLGPVTMTFLVDAETRQWLKTRFSPQPGVSLEIIPTGN